MAESVRRVIRILTACALCAAAASLAWPEGTEESSSASGSPIAPVVTYYEGRVRVDGERPEFGQKVPIGARVQTGRGSYCEIVFDERNILRIAENTIAIVSIDGSNRAIDLKLGAIGAVLDKLDTVASGGAFRVATPSVVAGVRGTVFFIAVESPDTTYACTCNGSLTYTSPDGFDEVPSEATHHRAHRFVYREGGFTDSAATLLYHDDAYMESIAEAIGVAIDWK